MSSLAKDSQSPTKHQPPRRGINRRDRNAASALGGYNARQKGIMLQARHLREHCYRMAIDEHHQEQGFLSESMRQRLAEPRSVEAYCRSARLQDDGQGGQRPASTCQEGDDDILGPLPYLESSDRPYKKIPGEQDVPAEPSNEKHQ